MKRIVIVALLVASFNCYGKYYPGTLVFENGKSREGFIEVNLGDVIFFKGWMESQPEEVPARAVKAIWISTNAGHKMHEYHYVVTDKGRNPMWLRPVEKGEVNLYVYESISQQDGIDKTEALEFYCLRKGEAKAKQIASHDNDHIFKSNARHFFADNHELVEKINSQKYYWGNVQELVRVYNQGF